jgi:hypothetical protein
MPGLALEFRIWSVSKTTVFEREKKAGTFGFFQPRVIAL